MLPTDILAFANRYDIGHTIMWEIVETVTDSGDNLDEIRDSDHLFDLTVEWLCAMIESVAEDHTNENLQTLMLHYLPVVFALAPRIDILQRARVIASTHDHPFIIPAVAVMLVRSDNSPTPPARLR